jgi:hypothetical protein
MIKTLTSVFISDVSGFLCVLHFRLGLVYLVHKYSCNTLHVILVRSFQWFWQGIEFSLKPLYAIWKFKKCWYAVALQERLWNFHFINLQFIVDIQLERKMHFILKLHDVHINLCVKCERNLHFHTQNL